MAKRETSSETNLTPAIAVLLGLSVLFGLLVLPRLVPGQNAMVGKPAPDFSLPVAANGDPGARMSVEGLKGHAVILDFWASWCGPCAIEAPVLDRLAKRYQDKGLVVVGVNVDDPAAVIQAYTAKKGLSYPMLWDDRGEAQRRYGVSKLPSLVVINKEGQVVSFKTGIVDEAALDDLIAQAL